MVHDMIWWYSSSEDGKGLHQFGFLVSIFVENKWISCCSKTKRESGCHDGLAQGAHRSTEKKSDSSVSRISSWPKSGFLWKQGFLENLLWLIIINMSMISGLTKPSILDHKSWSNGVHPDKPISKSRLQGETDRLQVQQMLLEDCATCDSRSWVPSHPTHNFNNIST